MDINFERVDNETPFKVCHTDILSPESPSFWINPAARWNKKTKAKGKGFVFVEREVAIEFVCRFISHVISSWPETLIVFSKFMQAHSERAETETPKEVSQ